MISDLGNVGNQLKSVHGGSSGKLIHQGQGQGMAPQGYGHPCCGEPYTMGEGMPAHNRPCISYCNAPSAIITNQTNQMQQSQVYTALTHNQANDQVLQDQNAPTFLVIPPESMFQGHPNQSPLDRFCEREPILPVDNYTYNTIGQPIELVPAKNYHVPVPNLPQTLSPQTVPSSLRTQMYNNVKSTDCKHSITSRQQQQEITPSRVQQVYNQYNGSQSCTIHNQNEILKPATGQTVSDGRLNVAPPIAQNRMFLEKVGGDTAAHSQAQNKPVKEGQVVGQVEDKNPPSKADMKPIRSTNLRNGLQDMVFTSNPHSTAWSFNGRRDQSRSSIRA